MGGRALKILDHLYFFERGYLCANHLAWRAASPVLIDTGYKASFAETAALLNGIGIRLETVGRIVNTHTHCDHIGGNHAIQHRSGCAIALHPAGKGYMDSGDDRSPWWRYYHQEADFFEATEALQDGDRLFLGPHEFEIMHTPGHASDGLVLYNREHRLLISADTLWERDVPVMTLQIEGPRAVETMLDSLARISHLAVRQVFPGHGAPFDDFMAALQRAEKRYRRYLTEPARIGWDQVKKIIIYTLMMKKSVPVGTFFDALMQTAWYPQTVDAYLGGDHRGIYERVMDRLAARRLVRRDRGRWTTTVTP
jgi:glyoxylase-like metal-dependent hydrolase (beta-lactamase superfamily II)